jgi:hypothetical protein
MAKDFIQDIDGDLKINNGDFVIGESEMQEVAAILEMSQGELRNDPLIGANLTTQIRSVENVEKIKRLISVQLELDEKDYDDIKEKIELNIR